MSTCSVCNGRRVVGGFSSTWCKACSVDDDTDLLSASLAACREDIAKYRALVERLEKERDEAKRHLDGRIRWQLEAVLHLQTFRALFDAAILMREGHEGCIADPACGDCFRCDFDKAVDQAKEEVATGVDSFIEESAGFWGRFAAKMQIERDSALSELAQVKARLEGVEKVFEAAVEWRPSLPAARLWSAAEIRLAGAIDAAAKEKS